MKTKFSLKGMLGQTLLFCLTIFVLFATLEVQAQNTVLNSVVAGNIKGVVLDSASNKGIEFITVALKRDKQVIKTAVTESSGAFTIKGVAPAKYTLVLMAIGYKTRSIPVEITEKSSNVDIGKIALQSEVHSLKDVAIIADKPLIKQEVDRITYDIQADPESKAVNVLDMMRKIPLLSVDASDNIKLKGSGNYKILINGRSSSMVARNPQDVFKSMPASNIQKIEVITTPPAKYDSEGLAGIINIITNKKIDAGYNAGISYRQIAPSNGPRGAANLTLKEGKFGLSGYLGLGNANNQPTISNSSRITAGQLPSSLLQTGLNASERNYYYNGTELSVELDTLNLITAEISLNGNSSNGENTRVSKLFNGSNDLVQGFNLRDQGRNSYSGVDVGLNYQLGFKRNKNQLLTFSYQISRFKNAQFNDLQIQDRVNFSDPNYIQDNNGKSVEQTIQVDYTHPVSKKMNFEAGMKTILRDNSSIFYNKQFDEATHDYMINPALSNNFKNLQSVYGMYNSYQYNLTNWGFKAGARVEVTHINADFISQATSLNRSFFNIIPSVSINRKFKDFSSLNFGYTQRIERPGIWQLNPFVNRSNPTNIWYGNPDLKPVLSNNFDIGYSKYKKGSINIGLNYSFANQTVQSISWYDEADKITRSTYVNIGKDKKLGTTLNVRYPLTKKLDLNIQGNLYYVWFQGVLNDKMLKNEGMQGYLGANARIKLRDKWKMGMDYGYNSPWVKLQGSSNAAHYMVLYTVNDIIKDKLIFSAAILNPFQKYRSSTEFISGADFTQNSYSQNYYRQFGADLAWRFGKLKESIKKNKRGINNDDVKGGEGSKSGG